MANLKSTTKTYIEVDYNDLDKFIQEVTGQKGYECAPTEEWNNDSEHQFIVNGEQMDFQKEYWEDFKSGKKDSCALYYILNGLCADKHIPAGNYLVKVCW